MSRIALVYDDHTNRPAPGSDAAFECAVGLAAADFYEANRRTGATSDMLMTVAFTHALGVCLNIAKRSGIPPEAFPELVRDIALSVVAQTGGNGTRAPRAAIMGVAIGHA